MRRFITTSVPCAVLLAIVVAADAEGPRGNRAPADSAWFGVPLPGGLGDPHRPVVPVPAAPAPVPVPAGEDSFRDLESARIRADLETIVGFSRQDRAAGNQMWGRVTGRPAAEATVRWVAGQFQRAGLSGVEVQAYPATAEMWWPRSREVRVLASPAFGPGSRDLVLESALPTAASRIPGGTLTAALIDAGSVNEPVPAIEVTGKVAVQRVRPASGVYSERGRTVDRARALLTAGAAAVFNVIEQTGNMHVRDFGNCGGPCFNLGTADGAFLGAVMKKAAEAGTASTLRVRLSLDTELLAGATGHNAVGIVAGRGDENIIVNAHADGWFDAAGDNGDGLAVLVALARHFARPEHRLDRTLVLVASGGHHSPGLNGPANFVKMNPGLTAKTVLVLNLEHIAQLQIRSETWKAEASEQPMNFGISNEAPAVAGIARRGVERYGFRLNPTFGSGVPGDLGGYGPLGVPRVQAIHSGPMYHTSGDVLETISVPGLERAARFYAFFLSEIARASHSDLGAASR